MVQAYTPDASPTCIQLFHKLVGARFKVDNQSSRYIFPPIILNFQDQGNSRCFGYNIYYLISTGGDTPPMGFWGPQILLLGPLYEFPTITNILINTNFNIHTISIQRVAMPRYTSSSFKLNFQISRSRLNLPGSCYGSLFS